MNATNRMEHYDEPAAGSPMLMRDVNPFRLVIVISKNRPPPNCCRCNSVKAQFTIVSNQKYA